MGTTLRSSALALLPALLLPGMTGAQQNPKAADTNTGARELFYLAAAPTDELPPIRRLSAGSKPAAQPKPAKNLGIRYNLLMVDGLNRGTPVDSDHVFINGDRVALEIESNRSGYLYVLARQSSGRWMPLLPSPEMADESNVINPGKRIRVPENYYFEINDPPGAEHLVLVFSRDPRDFYDLYEEVRNRPTNDAPSAPARRPSTAVQVAEASPMENTISKLEESFGTRDLAIRKVSRPMKEGEPAGSVYVVNTSDRPASSVVTEIEIRHR